MKNNTSNQTVDIGKRTKGEWKFAPETETIFADNINQPAICVFGYKNPAPVFIPNPLEVKENAEFICKAVNLHDELVQTLARLIDRIEENQLQSNFPSAYGRALNTIDKALNSKP